MGNKGIFYIVDKLIFFYLNSLYKWFFLSDFTLIPTYEICAKRFLKNKNFLARLIFWGIAQVEHYFDKKGIGSNPITPNYFLFTIVLQLNKSQNWKVFKVFWAKNLLAVFSIKFLKLLLIFNLVNVCYYFKFKS